MIQKQSKQKWIILVLTLLFVGVVVTGAAMQNKELTTGGNVVSEEEALVPCTADTSSQNKCLSFIAFGDSGSGNSNQYAVAKQMVAQYQKHPFEYALMLGDNIYDHGNVAKYGEARFKKPYKALLDSGVQFVTALGNHDIINGNGDDQIEFFNMPGRYYDVDAGVAHIFVLDTNRFAREDMQKKWLDKKLAVSTAPWKILMGHHPVFTSGAHTGERDITRLKNALMPYFLKYDIDLFLAGHDHGYERFKPIAGATHFVSGGAGAWLRDFKQTQPNSLIRVKRYHFLRFDLNKDHLNFQAIDKEGHVFDMGYLIKQKQQHRNPNLPPLPPLPDAS